MQLPPRSTPSQHRPTPSTLAWDLVQRHARPRVIAHRGASGYAPENTPAAYRHARQLHCTSAETDVHLSADGRVVAIHDATLTRTTGTSARVRDTALDVLQGLNAGGGQGVPTLEQVLEASDPMVLCVEIKQGAGIERQVLEILDQTGSTPRAMVFAFDPSRVAVCKLLAPQVPALLLCHETQGRDPYDHRDVEDALAVGADAVGVWEYWVTPGFVEQAHAAGLPVFVYTVDKPERAVQLAAMGVDAIISNVPDRIEQALREA